jgi:7-cyano-7-deazaguanine synthase
MNGLLLSGGMDSICLAWWKRPEIAITVDYGQKPARAEIAASAAVAGALGIPHEVVSVDCSSLGSGDMAGTPASRLAPASEWWPFRNQLLVTLAGMAAVRADVRTLMIGCLSTDGIHADGRPEFIDAMSALMGLQEGAIAVTAPAIGLDAVELVKVSGIPKDILAWAHSCHVGDLACGSCRGCIKHYRTWEALGDVPY